MKANMTMVAKQDKDTFRRDWAFYRTDLSEIQKVKRVVRKIIVHHTGFDGAFSVQRWYDIHRSHQRKGWRGIGYHYGVSPEGRIYALRPANLVGSHTLGHNADSIGVVVWGYKKKTPEAIEALAKLVAYLCDLYDCPFYFHSDLGKTICPYLDKDDFSKRVQRYRQKEAK